MVILDTCILIDMLRQKETFEAKFQAIVRQYECGISMITVGELYSGKKVWTLPQAKKDIELLLSGLTIRPMTKALSIKAGEIRAKYNIDLEDAIIAATAIDEERLLVTRNTKHFSQIKELKIIDITSEHL